MSTLVQLTLLGDPEIVSKAPAAKQLQVSPIDKERERLKTQLVRVEALMADGKARSLAKIATTLKRTYGAAYLETSISARLRDLRKLGWTVNREKVKGTSGLFLYRLTREVL